MGTLHIGMNIALGGRKLGMPHDLLYHAGRSLGERQRRRRGMAARVRRQIAHLCPREGGVILGIKIIRIHADDAPLLAADVGEDILDERLEPVGINQRC